MQMLSQFHYYSNWNGTSAENEVSEYPSFTIDELLSCLKLIIDRLK